MPTHILQRILKIQFVRQVLGAVGGALVALALYSMYRGAHDTVRAYLIPPGADRASYMGDVRVNDASADHLDRIAARAAETAQRLTRNRQAMLRAQIVRPAASSAAVISSASSVEASSVAAAQVRQASSARAVATEAEMHAGAPALPSSGVGLWAAGFGALCVSALSIRKIRMLLRVAHKLVD